MDTLTVNHVPYQVQRLLGKGKGGYSYLVTRDGIPYTLKQIHHEPCSYYQFGDKLASELQDYRHLSALGIPMPKLLEVDQAQERILKEFIDGPTICQVVEQDQMKPEYLRQMEDLCQILYAANTNIDYFPTNFILREGKIIYIDYECNEYMEQWDFARWGIQYWSKTSAFLDYINKR